MDTLAERIKAWLRAEDRLVMWLARRADIDDSRLHKLLNGTLIGWRPSEVHSLTMAMETTVETLTDGLDIQWLDEARWKRPTKTDVAA